MRRRLMWWRGYTVLFEAFLVMLVAGWTINLFVTDVFDSNVLYSVMNRVANQTTWGVVLLAWLTLYTVSLWRMSSRGRIAALLLISWWWASVAIMLFWSQPASTGVVAYGATALSCIVAAVYHMQRAKDD